MPGQTPRRERRLSLRFTPEELALIEHAARLRTAGDVRRLITTAAVDVARKIVREREVTDVTEDIRPEFYAALLDTRANPALADLFALPIPDGYGI